jgi:hypothetical protein
MAPVRSTHRQRDDSTEIYWRARSAEGRSSDGDGGGVGGLGALRPPWQEPAVTRGSQLPHGDARGMHSTVVELPPLRDEILPRMSLFQMRIHAITGGKSQHHPLNYGR